MKTNSSRPPHISSVPRMSLRSSIHSNNALFITFRGILKAPKCLKPTIRWASPPYLGSRALSTNGSTLPWIEGYGDKINKSMEKTGAKQNGKKRGSSGSWDDAADSYFTKQNPTRYDHKLESSHTTFDRNKNVGKTQFQRPNTESDSLNTELNRPNIKVDRPTVDVAEEEEDSEPSNDESWGRVKEKFRKMVESDGKRKKQFHRPSTELDSPDTELNKPNREVDRRSSEDGEEEEDSEPVNDERWGRIKETYRKMVKSDERRRPGRAYENTPKEVRAIPRQHQEEWGRRQWKEVTGSSPPKMVGEAVYGVGPVLAALTIVRREFYALHVQEGLDLSSKNKKKKDKEGIEQVLQMAGKLGLAVKEASKHDLNMIVDSRPHQGLVLDASPLEMVSIKELESISIHEGKSSPLWVALDEVTDPQNFGAVVRSAYFFGATGVVVCAKNSAPLSGVVSKASAGSLELVELRSCRNMMQFLESSMRNGWRVLGASVSKYAVPLNEVVSGIPTILVLGSEGRGLRPLVSRSCSQLISIPGTLPHIALRCADIGLSEDKLQGEEFNSLFQLESLNVSVAAGILLYHLIGPTGNCKI